MESEVIDIQDINPSTLMEESVIVHGPLRVCGVQVEVLQDQSYYWVKQKSRLDIFTELVIINHKQGAECGLIK